MLIATGFWACEPSPKTAEVETSEETPLARGERLFQANCLACHMPTETEKIGPGLAGIGKRRSLDWLIGYVQDPQGFFQDDEEAQKVMQAYNDQAPMPGFPQLDSNQISDIVSYLDHQD